MTEYNRRVGPNDGIPMTEYAYGNWSSSEGYEYMTSLVIAGALDQAQPCERGLSVMGRRSQYKGFSERGGGVG
jgi:hypothetical protein